MLSCFLRWFRVNLSDIQIDRFLKECLKAVSLSYWSGSDISQGRQSSANICLAGPHPSSCLPSLNSYYCDLQGISLLAEGPNVLLFLWNKCIFCCNLMSIFCGVSGDSKLKIMRKNGFQFLTFCVHFQVIQALWQWRQTL